MPPTACKPCKERGRFSVAHRVVDGTPMCQGCFSGKDGPQPPKEEDVAGKEKVCSVAGCSKRLNANNRSGRCSAHFHVKKGRAGHARRKTKARRPHGPAPATIEVTPATLDAIWAALSPQTKAALLNKLPEV